jgi:hypothetical protein
MSKINASTELTFGTPSDKAVNEEVVKWGQPELVDGPKVFHTGRHGRHRETHQLILFFVRTNVCDGKKFSEKQIIQGVRVTIVTVMRVARIKSYAAATSKWGRKASDGAVGR